MCEASLPAVAVPSTSIFFRDATLKQMSQPRVKIGWFLKRRRGEENWESTLCVLGLWWLVC